MLHGVHGAFRSTVIYRVSLVNLDAVSALRVDLLEFRWAGSKAHDELDSEDEDTNGVRVVNGDVRRGRVIDQLLRVGDVLTQRVVVLKIDR